MGDDITPGTLQIKDVASALNGRAFGVLDGNRDRKLGFFTWLIPSAKPVGFLSFDLAGAPDIWECRGITIPQNGLQLAASLYYPGTRLPPMPKTWMVLIWHGSPPKKLVLQQNEKNMVDFRFRAFSRDGWLAATSGATSLPTADGNVEKRFVAVWDTESGKKRWQFDNVFAKGGVFHGGRAYFGNWCGRHGGGCRQHSGKGRILGQTRPEVATDGGFLGCGNGTTAMPIQGHWDSVARPIARRDHSCHCLCSARGVPPVGRR